MLKRERSGSSEHQEPKRSRSESIATVRDNLTQMNLSGFKYTYTPIDEVYLAAFEIDNVLNINSKKLSIVSGDQQEYNTLSQWIIMGNKEDWYYEGVLNLDDCGITSMIADYDICDTLKVVVQRTSLYACLYKKSESPPATYLEFEKTLQEYGPSDNDDFTEFMTGLSLVPKSALSGTKTLLTDKDGNNEEMPFKIDLSEIHSAVEQRLNTADYLKWDAYSYVDAGNFSRGYYELRDDSLIAPRSRDTKLFIECIKGTISTQYLIAIHIINDHKIVKYYGIGEEYTWSYRTENFDDVLESVFSKLIQFFIFPHYTPRMRPWNQGLTQLNVQYYNTLSEVESITDRIFRLTSNYS